MQINPYLTFDGTCEEAFKSYQKILGSGADIAPKRTTTWPGGCIQDHLDLADFGAQGRI
jgi:hypothetical protein